MRVTIIPVDGFVSIDGKGYSGLNLSFLSANTHAIQWYGTEGEIELKDDKGKIIENKKITSIDEFKNVIDVWQKENDKEAIG